MNEYISKQDVIDYLNGYLHSLGEDADTLFNRGQRRALTNSIQDILAVKAADVQPIDKDNMHIIYIGRKAYLAENTIMEFMKKMDIIRDSLAHIENYFDTYAETIRQINACMGKCTDITEVKYFIDRIKENSGYD